MEASIRRTLGAERPKMSSALVSPGIESVFLIFSCKKEWLQKTGKKDRLLLKIRLAERRTEQKKQDIDTSGNSQDMLKLQKIRLQYNFFTVF